MAASSSSTFLQIHRITYNNETSTRNDYVYLVFDMIQAQYLRGNRSYGRFIGSFTNQQNANESDRRTSNYLPLRLSEIEVGLLLEDSSVTKNVQLVEIGEILHDQISQFRQRREKYDEDLLVLKTRDYINLRKAQLSSMRDKILTAKRKKLNEQLTKLTDETERLKIEDLIRNLEASFDNDLARLETSLKKENVTKFLSKENTNTEIFMRPPEFYQHLFPIINISRSELSLFISELNQTCKYNAFKYFFRQGFYLTCGGKFGGDFLVYPGKPSEYHSQFIVVCAEGAGKLSFKELVTYSRMATSVKKTFVMALFLEKQAYLDSYVQNSQFTEKVLVLTSINWAHF